MFNISFLNAGILFASLAAVLPILIHLFSKQKPKTIYFSSLKFIKESLKERNKSIKLNNLLIIIIRTLIILLTILAISRPALKLPFLKNHQSRNQTALAIIVDNSYSMEYLADNQTELEKAKNTVIEINKLLNDKDVTILMTRDNQWNKINANLNYGKINEKQLTNIEKTLNPLSLNQLILDAKEKLNESNYLNKEIIIISDLQSEDLLKKSDIPVFFIPTSSPQKRENLACTNVQIESEYLKSPYEKTINFTVQNFSDLPFSDMVCKLNLNNSTVAEKMINIAPNQIKNDNFVISNCKSGWNFGYVEIKNERLENDNKYYFSFFINDNVKVGIFTDNSLDKSIDTMLDIYLLNIGSKSFLKPESFNTSSINEYAFFVFKLSNYSPQIKLLIDKCKENNKNALFIMDYNLSLEDKKWFENYFGIKFHDNEPVVSPIQFINKYNELTKIFQDKQIFGQTVKPVFQISVSSNTNPVLESANSLIMIANDNCLWNFDPSDQNSSFLFNSEFPIISFRTFQYLSNRYFSSNQLKTADNINTVNAKIYNNKIKELQIKNRLFFFNEPGIYTVNEENKKPVIYAVNLKDFKESNYSPMTTKSPSGIYFLDYKWKSGIFKNSIGLEIWKPLLLLVIALIILEMLLIKKHESRNK